MLYMLRPSQVSRYQLVGRVGTGFLSIVLKTQAQYCANGRSSEAYIHGIVDSEVTEKRPQSRVRNLPVLSGCSPW